MIFRQLFDAKTSTYTYLVGDESTRKAVLIDPVLEQVDRDLALIRELGHTVSTIGEEKRWNRRIAGREEPDFVALMGKLDLPAPRNIATAVPANHACGQLADAGN